MIYLDVCHSNYSKYYVNHVVCITVGIQKIKEDKGGIMYNFQHFFGNFQFSPKIHIFVKIEATDLASNGCVPDFFQLINLYKN